MSDKNLLKIQAGKQTAFDTAVTDTVKRAIIEDAKFTPTMDVTRIKEMRGSMAPAYIAYLNKIGATYMLKGTASYEDAPYELDAMFGIATPLGTGPYVYTYNGALTAVTSNPRIQTLYFGDSTDGVYKLTGATATKLHYSIKNADRLMFDVDGIGKQIASGASFAPLSDRTVTPIMAGDMTVYIDAWGGTIGTTAVPATVYSLDLTITAKRDLRYYLGAYTPGRVREFDVFDFDLKLTLEFLSGVTDAYLNSILALSSGSVFQKQVRLKATSGTNIFQIDLAGTNEKAPDMWTYDNNVQTVELTLKGTYNATLANWLKASVTNSISTLA